MGTTSQNGWSVDPATVVIYAGGDKDGVSVRSGDVATVFQHFLNLYHQRVEPVTVCNGYRTSAFNNSLAGSIKNSNHVSATAVDINGAKHPNEIVHPKGWSSGFTNAQIVAVRQLQAEFGNLIEWGMDFPVGTRDPMHFAVARGVSSTQIAALAAAIRADHSEGDDMSAEDSQRISNIEGAIHRMEVAWGSTPRPDGSGRDYTSDLNLDRTTQTLVLVQGLASKTGVDVDEAALAAALLPHLIPALLAQVGTLSPETLQAIAKAVADEDHRRSAD